MKAYLKKLPTGYFQVEDIDGDRIKNLAVGKVIEVKAREPRNYKFLQKMHVFFHMCYDYFCEYGISEAIYKGQKVTPNYKKFRHDLVILAGYYETTFNIRGEVQLVAKSIAYENCEEEEAGKIFNACINASIKYVYKYTKNEHELSQMVEDILRFTG